jgi:hypothetical protein
VWRSRQVRREVAHPGYTHVKGGGMPVPGNLD